ncbi:MAG: isoprenyl transferase [Kiritimatiellia bacterium]
MTAGTINKIPAHIAIIMDGNGRWARRQGKARLEGHQAGSETVRCVMEYCRDAGVRYLTLYAFSTENWSRPDDEIKGLMSLLSLFIQRYKKDLIQRKVRLRLIGCRADLPGELLKSLEKVERETAGFETQLIVALSYSGRSELTRAVQAIAAQVAAGTLKAEDVNEDLITSHLYAPDVPDPDLIIRTSGEMRVSNFLLWQCAYSEFYVTDVLWPDFREADFKLALDVYSRRQRRFGGVAEC